MAQEHAETIVVTVGIDRFCEDKFLPDAQVGEVHKFTRQWAEGRRFVVRYTADFAVVEIVPPQTSTGYSATDLIKELSSFFSVGYAVCPSGTTQIPTSVGVKGLDFAPDGTILAPR